MEGRVERYTEDFLTLSCDLNEFTFFQQRSILNSINKKKKKYDCVGAEYKKKYVDLFFKSKYNPSQFCRLHKINYRNFKNWLKIVTN